MILEPKSAAIFMQGYVGLMAEIYVSDPEHNKHATINEVVAKGRARCARDPRRLDNALARAEARGKPLEIEVAAAVRKMQLKKWIFLRDSKRHSLFLDPNGDG